MRVSEALPGQETNDEATHGRLVARMLELVRKQPRWELGDLSRRCGNVESILDPVALSAGVDGWDDNHGPYGLLGPCLVVTGIVLLARLVAAVEHFLFGLLARYAFPGIFGLIRTAQASTARRT
jgi:hypothetical protein